jgi:hypothetical protein
VKPADWAWVGVGLTVLAYEAVAAGRRDFELLSEAMDRYRASHPVACDLMIFYLAGHLTRMIPKRLDPIHLITVRLSR